MRAEKIAGWVQWQINIIQQKEGGKSRELGAEPVRQHRKMVKKVKTKLLSKIELAIFNDNIIFINDRAMLIKSNVSIVGTESLNVKFVKEMVR